MTQIRIGIDLGGTKIEAIALDAQGKELFRKRISTPQDDYTATLTSIESLVKEIQTSLNKTASIGIGIPGAISPATGLVKNANSTCLNGEPLLQDLTQLLQQPVRITNDANCFVMSEATDGAAKDTAVVFGVIIGTGTGGGIIVDGKILTGVNAIGGEWGHNPLPWPRDEELPGPECYCGKQGCIETFLSGPGFTRDHLSHGGQGETPAEILAQSENNDALAMASLERYENRMARALASIINVIDPEVIVLGGGMSNIKRLYDSVPRLWGKYVFSDHVDTKLVPPMYGDSSGVRGAAWLWPK